MRRYSEPNATTASSLLKNAYERIGRDVAQQREHQHHGRAHLGGGAERLAHARALARAEVLADHRSGGERDRHHGEEQRLHHAQADAEPGLGRRAEAAR